MDYNSPTINSPSPYERQYRYRLWTLIFFALLLALSFIGLVYGLLLSPPTRFPAAKIVTIEEGESLNEVSNNFKSDGIVRSAVAFQSVAMLLGGDRNVRAGDYLFSKPLSSIEIARRVLEGRSGIPSVKVTFPEGITNKEMAGIYALAFPDKDGTAFLMAAQGREGYLFPDTYFVLKNTDEATIVEAMNQNFKKKITPLEPEIASSGKTLAEIVVMASIIEGEAFGDADRATISGILWKRLKIGMALQADATLSYVTGKASSELTVKDLAIDSKYNTYKYRGLPPTPIGNPGLAAIEAALHPAASEYLYYLHDKDGAAHYARTFEEHKANKAKYLK